MNFPTETDAFGSMKSLIQAALEEDAMLQAKQEGGVDDIVDEIQATLPEYEAEHPEGKKSDRDENKQEDTPKYLMREINGQKVAWIQDNILKGKPDDVNVN